MSSPTMRVVTDWDAKFNTLMHCSMHSFSRAFFIVWSIDRQFLERIMFSFWTPWPFGWTTDLTAAMTA
jgi:hypothetical protein